MTRRPWVNYGIIAANVLVFVAGYGGDSPAIRPWLLHPDSPNVAQFFTSVFLHADVVHLLGNMVFLWVFGNVLNDRFGHVAYLAFYLAGGVLAGVGYLVLSGHVPVLGASGAIAAVTGAYLVLFPRVRVTVLVILYFITTWQVSSLLFVGFQVLYNLVMTTAGKGGGIAYAAHSSGYVFGMLVAAVLLIARLLPRDPMDMLSLMTHSQRRQKYRRMVSRGYDPFRAAGPRPPATANGRGRWVETRSVHSAAGNTQSARELELRREISAACSQHDLNAAAERYIQLIQIADDAVLSRQNQLDVANQLMAIERYPAAADAYERFLRHYRTYENVADIHLMLGLLYGRYLQQYDQAEHYLAHAVEALDDPRKVTMAERELQAVRQRRGS